MQMLLFAAKIPDIFFHSMFNKLLRLSDKQWDYNGKFEEKDTKTG